MRQLGKWLGRGLLALFALLAAIWLLAPSDTVDREIAFDANQIAPDIDQYLTDTELQFSDIVPGTAKRVIWAGAAGTRTPLAVVYMHGFSATSQEIRPVPDEVARALGANLFFTRLAGHGRGSAPMAEPVAGDWIEDMAEAMAIGRRLGDRVLVISTSTGATLAAIAATDADLSRGLAGIVMISPNFGLISPAAAVLDLPLARLWGPVLAGPTRSFAAVNADHARYWTTSYPTTALFAMAALVRHARGLDYAAATAPLLMIYAPQDQVIDPARIVPVTKAWGGPVQTEPREMTAGDDRFAHVIAGDILSPGQTEAVITLITTWAKGL